MEDKLNEVVDVEEVETESYAEASDSGRDLVRDGLAVGAGLLALDGLYHVGKFAYTKGVKPLCGKIKTGFQNAKAKRAEKKASKAPATGNSESNVTE